MESAAIFQCSRCGEKKKKFVDFKILVFGIVFGNKDLVCLECFNAFKDDEETPLTEIVAEKEMDGYRTVQNIYIHGKDTPK